MQLQVSAAADAQRWEERLLALQAQLQEQQRSGSGAAAQQTLLQAEVAELRQILSAKDQQIGALSSGGRRASRPGSADTSTVLQHERLQAQVCPRSAAALRVQRSLDTQDMQRLCSLHAHAC